MARDRYIVAYDISDDKRRTRVSKRLESFGDRLQYSVFTCDLNDRERIDLSTSLETLINQREDQVIFVSLGPADGNAPQRVLALGRKLEPPTRARIV